MSKLGANLGIHTADVTAENKRRDEAGRQARAAANARVAQAEYEEQGAKGAARTRARRRRGFQSTILTGEPSALGGSASVGGTLLGD